MNFKRLPKKIIAHDRTFILNEYKKKVYSFNMNEYETTFCEYIEDSKNSKRKIVPVIALANDGTYKTLETASYLRERAEGKMMILLNNIKKFYFTQGEKLFVFFEENLKYEF